MVAVSGSGGLAKMIYRGIQVL